MDGCAQRFLRSLIHKYLFISAHPYVLIQLLVQMVCDGYDEAGGGAQPERRGKEALRSAAFHHVLDRRKASLIAYDCGEVAGKCANRELQSDAVGPTVSAHTTVYGYRSGRTGCTGVT